jgi:hypothetical protein
VPGRWSLEDETSVVVGSSFLVGQPFTIKITTHGNSCVSFHSTEVDIGEHVVDIRPYDRRHSLDGFCDDILLTFDHSTEITLDERARTLIRVHGSFDERGREAIERDFIVHPGV